VCPGHAPLVSFRPLRRRCLLSEHPVDRMVRDFQDRITRGTFDGVYGLEQKALDHVMQCQAAACVVAFRALYQISADLDLDAFLEKMKLGGSGKVRVQREANALLWEELHEGQCVCPLVTRKVIALDSGLCRCAVHWLRKLFEPHVRGPVEVELIHSVAMGQQNCSFRVRFQDAGSS